MNTLKTILIAFALTNVHAIARAQETLDPASVWADEIEEMYETDVPQPKWMSLEPLPENQIIVRGLSGSASTGSAKAIAIREQILPRIKTAANLEWTERDQAIAMQWAEMWLEEDDHILNEFEQPFFKVIDGERFPAFTREAILLDLPEDQISHLAHRLNRAVSKTRKLRRGIMFGSVGFAAAVFVFLWFIYWVLDRLTRGYYAGTFRTLATTAFLMSAGLIWFVARAMLNAL